MNRRTLLIAGGGAGVAFAGCLGFANTDQETASKPSTKATTARKSRAECDGSFSELGVIVDNIRTVPVTLRIDIDITRLGTPQDVLSVTKQLEAAPSEEERSITEFSVDVERTGAYDVVMTVDDESPETHRWHVADGCDGLYIRVLPEEGVLVSGSRRD